MYQKILPGPPNFENIDSGDKPTKRWMIKLDTPITCAKGAPVWGSKDILQLEIKEEMAKRYENKHIYITGSLKYAELPTDYTPLLISASEISIENPQPNHEAPSPNEIAEPITLNLRDACEHYLSMADETYMFLITKEPNHARKAILHAEKIYLSPKYIDFMINAANNNIHDALNLETIHTAIKEKNGDKVNTNNESYEVMVLGCMMNPQQVIPNYNTLVEKNLIEH